MAIPRTFTLNDTEVENITNWLKSHAEKCPHFGQQTQNHIGSPVNYIFTPSGMGNSVRIKCNCGEEKDVGDYDDC